MASIIRFPDVSHRKLPLPVRPVSGYGADAWVSWFGKMAAPACAPPAFGKIDGNLEGNVEDLARDASPRESDLALAAEGLGNHYRAWFGRSGRRYIVTVHAPDGADPACGYDDALLLAVRRDARGRAVILEGRDSGDSGAEGPNERWILAMRERGATELHVHLLARDALARQRVLRDLTD